MFDKAYNPDYLENILSSIEHKTLKKEEGHQETCKNGQEPPVLLDDYGTKVWNGEELVNKDDDEVDRSASLYKIGAVIYERLVQFPLNDELVRNVVVDALGDRDVALDLNKYRERNDPKREYQRIVE